MGETKLNSNQGYKKVLIAMLLKAIREDMGADYDIIEKYNSDVITGDYGASYMRVEHEDGIEWENFCEDPFVAILFDAINIIQYGRLLKFDEWELTDYEKTREDL